VERSIRVLQGREVRGSRYWAKAILLDADRLGKSPGRDRLIEPLAKEHDLHVVWQRPCHEAFLLRHIAGYQNRQPTTSKEAHDRLIGAWPDYQKGSPAAFLLKYLSLKEIALACTVEPELASFLKSIKYFS